MSEEQSVMTDYYNSCPSSSICLRLNELNLIQGLQRPLPCFHSLVKFLPAFRPASSFAHVQSCPSAWPRQSKLSMRRFAPTKSSTTSVRHVRLPCPGAAVFSFYHSGRSMPAGEWIWRLKNELVRLRRQKDILYRWNTSSRRWNKIEALEPC